MCLSFQRKYSFSTILLFSLSLRFICSLNQLLYHLVYYFPAIHRQHPLSATYLHLLDECYTRANCQSNDSLVAHHHWHTNTIVRSFPHLLLFHLHAINYTEFCQSPALCILKSTYHTISIVINGFRAPLLRILVCARSQTISLYVCKYIHLYIYCIGVVGIFGITPK